MFIDGSFYFAPLRFYQVVTFHGILPNGKTFLAGFILLQNKTESSYREAFSHLKQNWIDMSLNFNLVVIMTDFEKGLQNSIQKELAINSRLNGFWFHLSQAIQRKAVSIFGQNRVFKDYHLYRWIAKYSTLALIPIDKINVALGKI